MRFSVLASGSKANCTFIEVGGQRFLIDCGLSQRQVEQRLCSLGIAPDTLTAVFVTHEHSDHTIGLASVSRRFRLPVYANRGTAGELKAVFGNEIFETGVAFEIGGVKILPFAISHDATEPVGYLFDDGTCRFGFVTDLGRITAEVRNAVRGCHAMVLESNHDEELLQQCSYPWDLKQRIASSHGHLSNRSAAAFLASFSDGLLETVVLAHLSENSNTPRHALAMAYAYVRDSIPTVCCASVARATPLFAVGEDSSFRPIAV